MAEWLKIWAAKVIDFSAIDQFKNTNNTIILSLHSLGYSAIEPFLNNMINEIKTWILIAVAGAMATILGYIIKVVTAQVINRLDEIVTELKQLTHTTTIQNEQIKGLQEQDAIIRRRLYKQGMRIRALEFRSANQADN